MEPRFLLDPSCRFAIVCSYVCCLACVTSLRANPVDELAAKLEPTRKLSYKQLGDRKLYLHIFEPSQSIDRRRAPCLVLFHGGGWTGGNPRRMYPYADHFARQSFVAISVEYRLLSAPLGTTVSDCVKDGRSAIRFIREHAEDLGVDPNRIAVAGASAGGHIAAGTAMFDNLIDSADHSEFSSRPDKLVLLYPVIDTSTQGYGNAKIGADWKLLSPLHQVRPRLPPTIVFHGTADTVTPFAGATAFRDEMLRKGNQCQLEIHQGGKHGYLIYDLALFQETLTQIKKFVDSH